MKNVVKGIRDVYMLLLRMLGVVVVIVQLSFASLVKAVDLQDIAKLGTTIKDFRGPVEILIEKAPTIFKDVQQNTTILETEAQGIQDQFGKGKYDTAIGQMVPFLDTLGVLSMQIAMLISLLEPIFKPTSDVVGIFDKNIADSIQQVATTLEGIRKQLSQLPETEKKVKETLDKILPIVSIVSKFM